MASQLVLQPISAAIIGMLRYWLNSAWVRKLVIQNSQSVYSSDCLGSDNVGQFAACQ
jgi:hypothetical protein